MMEPKRDRLGMLSEGTGPRSAQYMTQAASVPPAQQNYTVCDTRCYTESTVLCITQCVMIRVHENTLCFSRLVLHGEKRVSQTLDIT